MKLKYIPFKEKHDLHSDLLVCLKKHYSLETKPIIDKDELDYLFGLAHAGIKDADQLILAIKKHGKVQIFTE